MKKTTKKHVLSGVLCMVLTAAVALGTTGCSQTKPESPSGQTESMTVHLPSDTPHQKGSGKTVFDLTVVEADGDEIRFEISTDAETVGEALQELDLIRGEEGPFGLMVTMVNNERHVYEEDNAYWGFYIDGEYAMSGVDETPIEAGKTYAFRAEPA